MQQHELLIYGANGYSGTLIARYATVYNLQPILAGRREEAVKPLALKLNLPYRIFDLTDRHQAEDALKDIKVVIHAAGPYDFTAKQMLEVCLTTGTHYLDLNGDLDVFEMLKTYDIKAKQSGIMLLPGAGFDVVPTDCLALYLKKLLPDATELELAFAIINSGLSRGTAITTINKLGELGASRKDGKIIAEPVGCRSMWVNFFAGKSKGERKIFVMSLPWGDVSTAYFTTGIPSIRSYTSMPPGSKWLLKFQGLFNWILRKEAVRNFIKKQLDKRPAGPDDNMRSNAQSVVWGRVTNTAGKSVTARLVCPEAYDVTAHSTLLIAQKILAGNFKTGYQTPASAYGENLVLEMEGVERDGEYIN